MCENSRQRVIHLSSAVAVIFLESEAISEKQIDKEEAAIDALLDGDDSLFDKLEY